MRFPVTVMFKYLPFRETLLDAVFGVLYCKGFRKALEMTESIVLVEDCSFTQKGLFKRVCGYPAMWRIRLQDHIAPHPTKIL